MAGTPAQPVLSEIGLQGFCSKRQQLSFEEHQAPLPHSGRESSVRQALASEPISGPVM